MNISALLITHNEEKNIRRALESLSWVDEIIVVDDHSTDDTVAIARSYPRVTVIERDWAGYGAQRNYGIDQATKDWVLVLDADEEVPAALRAEIKTLLAGMPAHAAYRLSRSLYFAGKFLRWGGTRPDYQVRLFKRGTASYNDALLHERLKVAGSIGTLSIPLLHYSYPTITAYFERFNRYSTLDAQRRQMRGERFSVFRLPIIPLSVLWRLFVRGGLLDGLHGIMWALFCAWYDFVKYAKLLELQQSNGGTYESKH